MLRHIHNAWRTTVIFTQTRAPSNRRNVWKRISQLHYDYVNWTSI